MLSLFFCIKTSIFQESASVDYNDKRAAK